MSNIPEFMGNPLDNWYEEYYKLVYYHIKKSLSNCSEEEIEDKTSEVFRRATRWLQEDGASIENPEKRLIRMADSVCGTKSSPVRRTHRKPQKVAYPYDSWRR